MSAIEGDRLARLGWLRDRGDAAMLVLVLVLVVMILSCW